MSGEKDPTSRRGPTESRGSTERPDPTERPSAAHPYPGEGSPSEEPRSDSGYHHRAERRSARRAARRRKRVARLSLVAGPVVVVILVIVALLVFLGGPESTSGAETTTTTVAAGPIETGGGSVLMVEQGEEVPAVILLLPEQAGGFVLAIPGNTLLKTESGFKTPTELHASDQEEALRIALAEDLGVDIGPVAWLQWSGLREALGEMGQAGSLPAELETTGEDAGRVAEAVVAVLGASQNGGEAAVWEQMEMAGDADGFRANAKLLSASISDAGPTVAVLPGKVVEGVGFEYFEPDLKQARALLGGESPGAEITMEVQNGSGVVGIAQQVGAMLEPLGYEILPFRNAEGFPDVTTTRILVAAGADSEAERVRAVLGVGRIEQDGSLEPGRIIVIVGKDFVPPVSTGTQSAQ
jgi:hypothetical protein